MKSTTKPLSGIVDILVKGLDFDHSDLIAGISDQLRLFETASRYRISKMEARMLLDSKYELLRSEVAAAFRESCTERGEKFTVDSVKEAVTSEQSIQDLRAKLETAEREEEYSKLLLEAFRQRRDMLRMVVDLSKGEQIAMNDAAAIQRDLHAKAKARFQKG